jgi:nitrate reductase gamma subunit
MSDLLLFVVLPYAALVVFFLMTIQRYRRRKFTYSALSSQFLENRIHFWGSVPFHYGILGVLFGHLVGFLFPKAVLGWNAAPFRLFLLETTGLALAVLALIGYGSAIYRRFVVTKARIVTTPSDWILHALLMTQIVTGILVAVRHSWGSSWYATSAAPWLWSLFTLSPDASHVAPLPTLAKLHLINAFVLIGYFPFTRLVHILVVPNPYLWRRTQVVLWNSRKKGKARRVPAGATD